MPKVGKFFKCQNYHLMVCPSKEVMAATVAAGAPTAAVWAATAAISAAGAAEAANYWSEHFNCKVKFSQKEDIFYVIEKIEESNEIYLFCLFPNFAGWIVWKKWLKLEEVKS